MTKQKILNRINEIIQDEKGHPVNIDQLFKESDLDSLGITLTLVTIDAEFPIFKDIPEGQEFEYLDTSNLTMRDLVNKCKLSIMTTPTEPSVETVI